MNATVAPNATPRETPSRWSHDWNETTATAPPSMESQVKTCRPVESSYPVFVARALRPLLLFT